MIFVLYNLHSNKFYYTQNDERCKKKVLVNKAYVLTIK